MTAIAPAIAPVAVEVSKLHLFMSIRLSCSVAARRAVFS
jgi:hypothetical protein